MLSDADADARALAALRDRQTAFLRDIDRMTAAANELAAAIEIVERHGRKRPGPKPGAVRLADPPEPEAA